MQAHRSDCVWRGKKEGQWLIIKSVIRSAVNVQPSNSFVQPSTAIHCPLTLMKLPLSSRSPDPPPIHVFAAIA